MSQTTNTETQANPEQTDKLGENENTMKNNDITDQTDELEENKDIIDE